MPALRAAGDIRAYKTTSGRSAIRLGPALSNYTGVTAAPITIGAIQGAVEINPNHEATKLFDSALQGPYGVIVTGHDWIVSAEMTELDVYNVALVLSYSVTTTSVTASSLLLLGAKHNLGQVANDDYYSLSIQTEGATNTNAQAMANNTIEFFKVFPQTSGPLMYDRTAPASVAVDFHCLSSDIDEVGRFVGGTAIALPVYQ